MTDYYVSNAGSDVATGLIGDPWENISRVETEVFNAGDTISFNRGDTWREALFVSESGSVGLPITYGAYGTGADPKLLGSIAKNSTGDWTDETGNIWYASSLDIIMNLIMDSESVVSTMVATKVELVTQGMAWYDNPNDRIYVYSVGNPATFYNGVIECAKGDEIIWVERESYITIENLDLRYTGDHGILFKDSSAVNSNAIVDNCTVAYFGHNLASEIAGIRLTDITNFTFSNCTIDQGNKGIVVGAPNMVGPLVGLIDNNTITNMILGLDGGNDGMAIGGGDLAGTVISNNDISSYTDDAIDMGGGSNILFTGNTVHDCIDTVGGDGNGLKMGLSGAGDSTGNQAIGNYIYNIPASGITTNSGDSGVIAYNVIENCNMGIVVGNLAADGGNDNWEIYNNVCYACVDRGIQINAGIDAGNKNNATVQNNICSGLATADIKSGANTIITGGYNCLINDASVTNADVYTGAANDLYATDPLFTDPINDDFTLTGTSPCIDDGLFVGLTSDFIGTVVPQGSAPDMGAYELLFFSSSVLAIETAGYLALENGARLRLE